eukprot:maker-scaffold1554_size35889-snap-gene-0.6 protein:Tk10202 transcript:maker-scaffold1554_size35889-snap-gene-0.6-mRNA-1 annotation:"glutamate receptor kainate 2-like"
MAAKMQHDTGSHVEYEPAIIYDSLLVLMNTVKALNYHYAPLLLTPQQLVPEHNGDPLGRKRGSASSPSPTSSVSCRSEKPWEYGPTFYNYLNAAQTEGMTGQLAFKGGRRSSLSLELMRYSRPTATVNKIGHWSRTGGLSVLNESLIESNDQEEVILRVVTRQEKPYVMINKLLKGNDAFDGFAIDLLKAISDVVGFKFRLYIVPDNLYGVYNHETGEWNGIVRQLTDKRADLAVASMTINYARETVIDFTKPFMNLGISILFKAPKDPATELFSFMNPLALEIWLYMLIAYILVSITIWIVARFSPYEWAHPHPCVDTGLVFQNDFTLPNSFWFAIGTLMQQGSSADSMGVAMRSTVRKAAKLAVYDEMIMRVKNHQIPPTILVDAAFGFKSELKDSKTVFGGVTRDSVRCLFALDSVFSPTKCVPCWVFIHAPMDGWRAFWPKSPYLWAIPKNHAFVNLLSSLAT